MQNTSHLIDALGGTNEVAKLCDVRPQAVSQWRTDGIPKARLMFLKVIRPDVDWDSIAETQSSQTTEV
jgi:DNA-binding transcriptional regulator YdaS (Cro superfamily)